MTLANRTIPHSSSPPSSFFTMVSNDVVIVGVAAALVGVYFLRDKLFASKPSTLAVPTKSVEGGGDPRDFIAKMKEGVCALILS